MAMVQKDAPIDWSNVEVFETPLATARPRAPTPAQLTAEIATLPRDRPPERSDPEKCTRKWASDLLGVTPGRIRQLERAGVFTKAELDPMTNRTMLIRSEVEQYAMERSSKKLDRALSGPEREQRRLEGDVEFNIPPVSREGTLTRADRLRARRDSSETIELLRELVETQQQTNLEVTRALREQTSELRELREVVSLIGTGLAGAGAIAGIVSVLPEEIKGQVTTKIQGLFRKPPPEPVTPLVGNRPEPSAADVTPKLPSPADADEITRQLTEMLAESKPPRG
jgi:hypothetical protein